MQQYASQRYILQGIDYLNSLVQVLTKFRYEKYALMGDTKKMFLQVKVNPFFPLSHVRDTKKRLY